MNENLYTEILSYLEIYRSTAPHDAVSNFSIMPKKDLSLCHFGLGLYIRNNYLTHESSLYQLFIANGVLHPDDMSALIIRIWHKELSRHNMSGEK